GHRRGGGAGRRRVTARAGRPRRQVAGERHAWGAVRDPPPGEAVRAGRAGERPGARRAGAPPAGHVPPRGRRRSAGRGGAEGGRRDRLDAEHENVRGALAQALGSGDVAAALTLAAAVWSAWHDRGRWHEARSWLERAVEAWDATEARAASVGLAGAAYGTRD